MTDSNGNSSSRYGIRSKKALKIYNLFCIPEKNSLRKIDFQEQYKIFLSLGAVKEKQGYESEKLALAKALEINLRRRERRLERDNNRIKYFDVNAESDTVCKHMKDDEGIKNMIAYLTLSKQIKINEEAIKCLHQILAWRSKNGAIERKKIQKLNRPIVVLSNGVKEDLRKVKDKSIGYLLNRSKNRAIIIKYLRKKRRKFPEKDNTLITVRGGVQRKVNEINKITLSDLLESRENIDNFLNYYDESSEDEDPEAEIYEPKLDEGQQYFDVEDGHPAGDGVVTDFYRWGNDVYYKKTGMVVGSYYDYTFEKYGGAEDENGNDLWTKKDPKFIQLSSEEDDNKKKRPLSSSSEESDEESSEEDIKETRQKKKRKQNEACSSSNNE